MLYKRLTNKFTSDTYTFCDLWCAVDEGIDKGHDGSLMGHCL